MSNCEKAIAEYRNRVEEIRLGINLSNKQLRKDLYVLALSVLRQRVNAMVFTTQVDAAL